MILKSISTAAVAVALTASSFAITADFEAFNIRNNNGDGGTIVAPWDGDMSIVENAAGDGFSAMTPRAGQKVGYGTSALDGLQVNKLQSVNFTKVSGALGKLPYLNLWVKDTVTELYGIIALGGDFRGVDFASGMQDWLLYEYDTTVGNIDWLFDGGASSLVGHGIRHDGTQINLSELSNDLIFADPGSPYPNGVGTGAPRGGHGLNIIFGDTQANYVGEMEIKDLTFTYDGNEYRAGVPDTGSTAALLVLGFAALVGYRRKLSR